jgi:hypothetical protein
LLEEVFDMNVDLSSSLEVLHATDEKKTSLSLVEREEINSNALYITARYGRKNANIMSSLKEMKQSRSQREHIFMSLQEAGGQES